MLLSIVIPTKNRYQYLRHFVEAASSFEDDGFEVVIQDNSDDNAEFDEFLQPYLSSSIKYFYCDEPLSGRENADRAILNSAGEYVCMIGDDDGFSSKIMRLVRWMQTQGYESCRFTPPTYMWPDFVDRPQITKGMWISSFKSSIHDIAVEKELGILLKTGGYRHTKLPSVHHGIVSRAALDKVYDRAGSFFPGMSLDSANIAALSFVVKKHAYSETPYTVGGLSGSSTFGGGNNLHPRKSEFGGIKGLDSDIIEKWEKEIPLIWTVQGCATHATIQAIRAMGQEDALKRFNYNCFYGLFIACDPQLISLIPRHVKGLKNFVSVFAYTFAGLWTRSVRFASNFLRYRINLSGKKVPPSKLPTIKEAIELLDKHIPDE